MDKVAVICIAGGIGAGKSVVSRIMRLAGYEVYDCDREARRLMTEDAGLKADICSIAGSDAYFPDGTLNRKVLAERLFGTDEIRDCINRSVHSAVKKDIEARAFSCGKSLMFVETAIPVVSGIAEMCDMLWLVEASEATRIRRVEQRGNLPAGQIKARINAQYGEEEAIRRMGEEGLLKVEIIKNENSSDLLGQIGHIMSN